MNNKIKEEEDFIPISTSLSTNKKNVSIKNKKGRIIVRNLRFNIKEQQLREVFMPFGQIDEINIPIDQSTNKQKGFAFIQYSNKNQAIKAIKKLNGSLIQGRQIICDLSIEKQKYDKELKQNQIIKQPILERTKELEEFPNKNSIRKKEHLNPLIRDEKEDLSRTIFIRNISFEATKLDVFSFFSKIAPVKSVKLCQSQVLQTHKGSGFVQFYDPNSVEQIVKMISQTDQAINFEIKGRQIHIFPALMKNTIPKKESNSKTQSKIASLNKCKNLNQILQLDNNQKRNIKLSLLGNGNDQYDQQKELNLKEKIEKLKNPNNYVSDTRIVLKHLPIKNFGIDNLKSIIKEWVEKIKMKFQKFQNVKLVKQIKLLSEKNKIEKNTGFQLSKGIGFVEFNCFEVSKMFLDYILENSKQLFPNSKSQPIVEFAIENSMKLWKKNQKLQKFKQQKELNQQNNKLSKEKIDFSQIKNTSKAIIQQIIEEKNMNRIDELKNTILKIKSRGLKQRLKKKAMKQFGNKIFQCIKEEKKQEKIQDQFDKSQIFLQQKSIKINNELSELDKIKAQRKKLKQEKSKKLDEADNLDLIIQQTYAQQYLKKIQQNFSWTKI